jgi:hypothetical protein
MIRFLPDTWTDALLRPVAMAAPNGGVYVELIAPDFRFIFVLVLVLALVWVILARQGQRRLSPALILLGLTAVAFVPWLSTTGNGRYFIPFLLMVGPLCIGLLHLIPARKLLRVTAALGMVLWQAYLIYAIDPWRTWGHISWGEGAAFEIHVPKEVAAQPATYVTLSSISYSIIAPRFHPDSRWVNVSSQPGVSVNSPDSLRTQALISAPGPLRVIFPTVPGGQRNETMDPALADAIDDLLARHRLSIKRMEDCRLLPSAGMAGLAVHKKDRTLRGGDANLHGFWLCPLARKAGSRSEQANDLPASTEQVFQKLERLCPRMFPPGETVSLRIPAGAVRGYPSSDFKLYVLDDGRVIYKYYRALNSVVLGDTDTVLSAGFSIDCDHVQGRTGLPWERAI